MDSDGCIAYGDPEPFPINAPGRFVVTLFGGVMGSFGVICKRNEELPKGVTVKV